MPIYFTPIMFKTKDETKKMDELGRIGVNKSELEAEKRLRDWEARMEARKTKEEAREKEEAERQRQAYLKRTGRMEMKP